MGGTGRPGHKEDAMHIVGMRTHAGVYRHNHANGRGSCRGGSSDSRAHGHGHDEESSQACLYSIKKRRTGEKHTREKKQIQSHGEKG